MRLSFAAAFALLGSLASVLADGSDVLDLTKDTFEGQVAKADLALVEFFAPWCGHCKNLAPHYEEAATELKSKNIKLAKVDCTEQQELCGEFGVNGYPTLKVFRNGVPTEYTGPRKADGIISYMIKQSLPPVSDVTSTNHDEFKSSDKVVLIAYGNNDKPIPKAFSDYANTARDSYLFGQFTGSPLPDLPESVTLPAIVLYKQFDEGYAVYPASNINSASADSIADFVKSNSMPLFDEISPENFANYAEQGLPLAYLFLDPSDTEEVKKAVEELRPVAAEHKGKINFVWIDGVKFSEHGKSLNLPGDKLPAFVIQDLALQTKYPFAGKVNFKEVSHFVQSYAAGNINPSIKSEPVPTSQNEPVYKLVADDWDTLFNKNADKDVFVEFYAPWCGHCQRLAPIWDSLGENFADNKNIVIAQMDATLNDVPPKAPFKVQGFPTLKFRPAGVADFIDYNGDRSLESLIEFVELNRQSEGTEFVDEDDVEEAEAEGEVHGHDEL